MTKKALTKVDKDEAAIAWALHMSSMLVRNPIIERDLGLTKTASLALWKRVNDGRSSPSGQGPCAPDWYVATTERRFQGALIILMYRKALEVMPKIYALPHSYYHFARITAGEWTGEKAARPQDPAYRARESDYTIPYSRVVALVTILEEGRVDSLKELSIKACKACESKFLARFDEVGAKCPLCV